MFFFNFFLFKFPPLLIRGEKKVPICIKRFPYYLSTWSSLSSRMRESEHWIWGQLLGAANVFPNGGSISTYYNYCHWPPRKFIIHQLLLSWISSSGIIEDIFLIEELKKLIEAHQQTTVCLHELRLRYRDIYHHSQYRKLLTFLNRGPSDRGQLFCFANLSRSFEFLSRLYYML